MKYRLDKEKIDISRLLVVLDDPAILVEQIKAQAFGNDGGHNGLSSIQETLEQLIIRDCVSYWWKLPKRTQVEFVLGNGIKPKSRRFCRKSRNLWKSLRPCL